MKKLLLAILLLLPSSAWAQCTGQFQTGQVCGNAAGVPALPAATNISAFGTISGGLTIGSTAVGGGTLNNGLYVGASGLLAQQPVLFLNVADQTLTGGANITSVTNSTGNITVDCGKGPGQYITGSTSAWTITAPANDGQCVLQVENPGASAVIPSFSGFSEGSNTGDALTTANNAKFQISIIRIHGISHYLVSALQ